MRRYKVVITRGAAFLHCFVDADNQNEAFNLACEMSSGCRGCPDVMPFGYSVEELADPADWLFEVQTRH
jgi:hypothetical protein